MKNSLVRVILLASLFVLLAVTAQAQQATASLTGVVTDPNGDVIPGVNVKVVNTETNFSRLVSSNEKGIYTISNLPIGEYSVEFSAIGFAQRNLFEKVTLGVGQIVSLNTQISPGGSQP